MLNQVIKVSVISYQNLFSARKLRRKTQSENVNSCLRVLLKSVRFFWIFDFHKTISNIAGKVKIFVM